MAYSRVERLKVEKEMKREVRRYSLRKVSTVGVASALIGTIGFMAPIVSADETTTDVQTNVTTPTSDSNKNEVATLEPEVKSVEAPKQEVGVSETLKETTATNSADVSSENISKETLDATKGNGDDNSLADSMDVNAVEDGNESVKAGETTEKGENSTPDVATEMTAKSVSEAQKATKDYSAYSTTNMVADTGLTELAYQLVKDAGLDVANLTVDQKASLNKLYSKVAETGTQMTYKQFQEIADTVVAQDPRYAIPYFNAAAIKNMKAATTRDAQTGKVADLDVWDSWPVQDVRTGKIVNWNGYQLVVAMMGIPNTNDNHLYLLYNTYADNNFDNWKNAGSIFGYGLDARTQQWSGSAIVNKDNTIQLFYTNVDTTDNNSNNQMLASATLNLAVENGEVVLKSVDNKQVLTPKGGDGYHYQSYAQWRSTFTGADNIAMRDPHVIEDENGVRYLAFEASTGTENYQSENQIYNLMNYGGNAKFKTSSLFRILENEDMKVRASVSNAAIGLVRLTGDDKTPSIAEYYTPLLSSVMVSDEIERPNIVKLGNKYYLFAASRLNHGSNDDAWEMTNKVVGDNVIMLGYVSDSLTSGYKPLNNSGVVLTASVPSDWRTATYSYYAVPVEGSDDTLLVTAYMTNRNEVAGKGNNSTWAPSFLIQVLPDGTTRVLAKMTEQGDWIWDESSATKATVGTLETSHLPGEDDGYIDWNVIGGYNLKPHMPVDIDKPSVPTTPDKPTTPTTPVTPDTPENPTTPNTPVTPTIPKDVPTVSASILPKTADSDNSAVMALGFAIMASMTAYLAYGGYKRKY